MHFPLLIMLFFRYITTLIQILQNATAVSKRQNTTNTTGIEPKDIETVMTAVYRRIDRNHSDFLNTTTWLARTYARTVNPNKTLAPNYNETSLKELNTSLTRLMGEIEAECAAVGNCNLTLGNSRVFDDLYDDGDIPYPYTGPISYFDNFYDDNNVENPDANADKNQVRIKKIELARVFSNKNGLEMTKKSIDQALKSTSESGTNGKYNNI